MYRADGTITVYYYKPISLHTKNVFVLFLSGVPAWRLINVSLQHNGGFLPGIILLTQSMILPSGNPFKCHEEVLYLQPMIPP